MSVSRSTLAYRVLRDRRPQGGLTNAIHRSLGGARRRGVALSGFGRQQRTIGVAPTQTVPLNVTLGLATLDEMVNVVGRSADVLTQTAQVATNFSQDLIAMLPTNRDINSVLLMAPAVHPSGPGGN